MATRFWQRIKTFTAPRPRRTSSPPRRRTRPRVEILEDRTVPTVMPLGGETLVPASGGPPPLRHSDVALDASGNYAVVWEQQNPDGESDIFLRTFNASGAPMSSSDVPIANSPTLSEEAPRVAISPDGTHLVVVWQQHNPNDPNSLYQIHYRYVTAAGLNFAGTVSTDGFNCNVRPDVAMAADGGFVVVFTEEFTNLTDSIIEYRRYGPSGTPIDPSQQDVPGADNFAIQDNAAVAITPNGTRFVVAWENHGDNTIRDTALNGSGSPVVTDQIADTPVLGTQVLLPAVGMAADGSFVLASQDSDAGGKGLAVHVSRFAADNSKLGQTSLTPPGGFDIIGQPAVAVTDDGRSIVTYSAVNSSTFMGNVYFQAYSPTGAQDGSGLVNTTTGGLHIESSVARRGDRIVVTFTSFDSTSSTIRSRLLQEVAPPPSASGATITQVVALHARKSGQVNGLEVVFSQPLANGGVYVLIVFGKGKGRRLRSRTLVLAPQFTAGNIVFLVPSLTRNDRFALLEVVSATDASGAAIPLRATVVNVTPQRPHH